MQKNLYFFVVSLVLLFTSCTKEELNPITEDQTDLAQSLESRSSDTVSFKIGKTQGNQGEQVCVDVSAKKFEDIVGFQYSLAWDPAVLSFSEVNNFNLPGLSSTSFGNPSSDRLTTSWFNPDLEGTTVPNNTTIYSVCFTIVGSSGTASDLDFTDNPTSIEVFDENFNILPTVFKSGKVKVN